MVWETNISQQYFIKIFPNYCTVTEYTPILDIQIHKEEDFFSPISLHADSSSTKIKQKNHPASHFIDILPPGDCIMKFNENPFLWQYPGKNI